MSGVRRFGVFVWLWSGACHAAPADPFAVGERALQQRDLPAALAAFDTVPVAHPRYPEARAAAAGVERCMRRGHETLLEGLLLRSEWRDREALTAFSRAREIWPGVPGAAALIQATEHRLALFPAAAKTPAPVVAPDESAVAGASAAPPAAPAVESAPKSATAPAGTTAGPDLVARDLVAVEQRLGRGELEGAVVDLLALAQRCPGDLRVRVRLTRVLHQRALGRYGQGALAQAIADWRQVLQMDPDHASAGTMLHAAEAELADQRGH